MSVHLATLEDLALGDRTGVQATGLTMVGFRGPSNADLTGNMEASNIKDCLYASTVICPDLFS